LLINSAAKKLVVTDTITPQVSNLIFTPTINLFSLEALMKIRLQTAIISESARNFLILDEPQQI